MKRSIISCLLAVGLWLTAAAANTVTLTSVQGHPGDEVEIAVMLANTDAVTALEVSIPLGDMLRYVEGSAVLSTERSNGHVLSAAADNGKLKIFIYSMSLSVLKGQEGELCRFRMKLGKEPAAYPLVPEVVMSDASGKAVAAAVVNGKVTILSPKIEVTTPTIDYGRVPIRSTYTKTLSVKNVGNEPLEITGFTFGNGDLSASPATCTVAAGGTQSIVLSYAPMQRGTIESMVTIHSNAINPKAAKAVVKAQPFSVNELHVQKAEGVSDDEVTIVLKMNNMEPIAGVQCSFSMPDQLVFVEGSAAVGSRISGTNHQVMGVMNGKKLTLFMYSMANAALPEGDGELMTFRVRLDGTSGTYRLTPTDVVLSNVAMENMVSAASGNSVVISSPKISAANTLNMSVGSVIGKSTATYMISNDGEEDLVISKVAFLDEEYVIEDELPIRIAPRKTEEIVVSYKSEIEGKHQTTMLLYTNDPTCRMKSVALSGEVREPNHLLLNGVNTETGYRLSFGLDNYTEIVALQMNVHWLPEMSTSSVMMHISERLKNHSYIITDIGNGVYQILIYSMDNKPILDNSGELFSLEYTPKGDVAYRNSDIRVSDIVMSDVDGVNRSSSAEINAKATFCYFTLQFVIDGKVISKQFIKAGTPIIAPEVSERDGYTFAWEGLLQTMPNNDLTIEGNYTCATFVLTYMIDGEIYRTETLLVGSVISPIPAPTKEGYTFSGWGDVPQTMPNSNITIEGSYTLNFYDVTMYLDEEVYQTFYLPYGMSLELLYELEVPEKDGYTFSGWKGIPSTMPAKNVVINGSYSVNSYVITYVIDGEVYTTETVAYGSKITAISAPNRDGYTFSGWSGVPNTMPAKDIVVNGSYSMNSYVITYVIDGEIYTTDKVAYGSKITVISAPNRDGYTFNGWSGVPSTMPAKDVVINGSFSVNSYKIVFILDGNIFAEYTLAYGDKIVVPEVPEKDGLTFSGWGKVPEIMPARNLQYEGSYINNPYTIIYMVDGVEYYRALIEYGSRVKLIDAPIKDGYTFSGWSEAPVTMPAKDIIISGTFAVNIFTITYYVDGVVYYTAEIPYGMSLEPLAHPVKEGYTFGGWSEIPKTMPAKDVVVNGTFAANSYTISYYVDGELYGSETICYGTTITPIQTPTKEGHTFNGWSGIPATMPANDVIVTGSFSLNSYSITYVVDGEVYKTESFAYRSKVVAILAPVKEGHTFSGWSGIPNYMPASNVTVTGSFSVNNYTITYVVDGNVYLATKVNYGEVIVLPDEPIKEGYVFAGWVDVPKRMPAHDVTINGSFEVGVYTVTYLLDDEVYRVYQVEYGKSIPKADFPEKEGYTFNGWGEAPKVMPAWDVIVKGSFTVNKYFVTFVIDGEIIASLYLEYGTAIVAPEAPEMVGYTFDGWRDVAATVPAHDVTYEGSYTANVFVVYYYVGDTLVHTMDVIYGEEIPEYVYEPTNEGDVFLGWLGEKYITMPAHDVTYTANIESGIEQFIIDNLQFTLYDLTGHKVKHTENLKEGIYIINGRKVMVR